VIAFFQFKAYIATSHQGLSVITRQSRDFAFAGPLLGSQPPFSGLL
jgi:hypothetical protein